MSDYDLVIDRKLKVPPALVWEAWTKPEHLTEWFCPVPWKVTAARIDLRPGGEFFSRMEGPNGEAHDNLGIFLEIVPERRLVTTDCLLPGWIPAPRPFLTSIIEMTPDGDGTHYVATARHADPETQKRHEEMGFFDGWNTVVTQMEEMIIGWKR